MNDASELEDLLRRCARLRVADALTDEQWREMERRVSELQAIVKSSQVPPAER